MIVGEAYVEVHAVTNSVRQEIKSGFDKGMKGTGTQAGDEFDKEMAKEVDQGTTRITSRMKSRYGSAGGQSGDSFARNFSSKVVKHFESAGIKGKLLGAATSFLGPVAGLIGAIGGNLVALTAGITRAAGAIPVLYSNVLTLVGGMGALKLATGGVGKAIQANLSGNTALAAKYMKALSPAAKEFVRYIKQISPELKSIKQTAAENLFPGVEKGIKAAMPFLPIFRKEISAVDKQLGNLAAGIGHLIGGPLKGQLTDIFRRNTQVTHQYTSAMLPLVDALVRVEHEMQPVQLEMAKLVRRGAQWIDTVAKANQANGSMARYFQKSFDRAKLLGAILKNVAGVLRGVFHAADPTGVRMLKAIDATTARWAAFVKTVGGQNRLQKYFAGTVPVMHEVVGIFSEIVKGFVSLGQNQNLVPLLDQIRTKLLPALGSLLSLTSGPLASSMVSLATQIANILGILAKAGATGYIQTFVDTLHEMLTVLTSILKIPGLGSIAGTLLGIAGAVSAVGAVAGKLGVLKLLQGIYFPKGGKLGAAEGGGGGIVGKVLGQTGAKPIPVYVTNWHGVGGAGGGGGVVGGAGGGAAAETTTAEEAAGATGIRALAGKIKAGGLKTIRRGIEGIIVTLVGGAVADQLKQGGHTRSANVVRNTSQVYGSLAAFGPEIAGPLAALTAALTFVGRRGIGTNIPKGYQRNAFLGTAPTTPKQIAATQAYLTQNPAVFARYSHQFPALNPQQIIEYVSGLMNKSLVPKTTDMHQAARDVFNGLLAGMRNETPRAVMQAKITAAAIMKQLRQGAAQAESLGEEILNGLLAGMKHKTPAAVYQAKITTGAIFKQMHETGRFGSPSKISIQHGEDAVEGWEIGMKRRLPRARRVAHNLTRAILGVNGGITDTLDRLGRTNSSAAGSAADELRALRGDMARLTGAHERLIRATESVPHGIVREQAKRGGHQWRSAELLAS